MAYLGLEPPHAAIALAADILPRTVGPYITMTCIGFILGAFGHLAKLRWMVVIGILVIFLATLVFPLAIVLTNEDPAPPGPDVPFSP